MKTVVLVGNKDNAQNFIDELQKSVSIKNNVCFINGQSVRIYYQSDASKVAKQKSGAIIVVTGNDNKTPQNVEKYHQQMPSDFTFTYRQNNSVAPLVCVQQIIRNEHVKKDEQSFAQKIIHTVLGKSSQETSAAPRRPLRI